MKGKITLKDILEVTHGKLLCGNINTECITFSIDSRKIQNTDTYIGIKGETIDGNDLWESTLQKGARGCILQKEPENYQQYNNKFIIVVPDTVKALQQIAQYKRNLYNIPVVAITGSVGKTSTKDMVASVLAQKYKILKTAGNYNNHLGLPLTILRLKDEELLVVEMGMNHLGEISILTNIAKPTVAIITNVGTAHIGLLGSRENILKAKLEILEGLQKEGTLIINNDNDLLHEWYQQNKNEYNIITYGVENKSDYYGYDIRSATEGSQYKMEVDNKEEEIEVSVAGNHFVMNSLCAIGAGKIFNIPIEDIKKGILQIELSKNRMDIINIKGEITIINDCYNANYDSVKAAIEYLGKLQDRRKIAVLGDMRELGEYSKELHEKVAEEIIKNNIDILVTVGEEIKYTVEKLKELNFDKEKIFHNNTKQEAINLLKNMMKEKDTILFKASNSMQFDVIIKEFI